jgi:hypothetical protein
VTKKEAETTLAQATAFVNKVKEVLTELMGHT